MLRFYRSSSRFARKRADADPRSRRSAWRVLAVAGIAIGSAALGGKIGLQMVLHSQVAGTTGSPSERQTLFDLLRPVALSNCELERFGEPHDGGYLLCKNLLAQVSAGYSYGIAGYDQWGCDVSTRRGVPVHQYDCFDTTRPSCQSGRTIFHEQCVAERAKTEDGRVFDTIQNQIAQNGHSSRRIVLKIDVEGAEWDAFLSAPDEVLGQIDQMAVEFHGVNDEKSVAAVRRLKQYFEVAHVHFNNATCLESMKPFPAWAYEVLFVSKRLAAVDTLAKAPGRPHPQDARNISFFSDCQAAAD